MKQGRLSRASADVHTTATRTVGAADGCAVVGTSVGGNVVGSDVGEAVGAGEGACVGM